MKEGMFNYYKLTKRLEIIANDLTLRILAVNSGIDANHLTTQVAIDTMKVQMTAVQAQINAIQTKVDKIATQIGVK